METKFSELEKAGWRFRLLDNGLKAIAPSVQAIVGLDLHCQEILQEIQSKWGKLVIACDAFFMTEIPNLYSSVEPLPNPSVQFPTYGQLKNMSDLEKYVLLEQEGTSAAITRIKKSKILAASSSISLTHGKPADQAIGQSIDVLWHPDELNRLMLHLDDAEQRGEGLINIEYWTWKWVQDENSEWVRERQNLVGNFWKIFYRGVPCRLSIGIRAV